MSSEKGGAPAVPRSNPLYGGPSGSTAGPKTPSWARRSDVGPSARGSSFSDVASTVASTPPDSPNRDHYSRDQFGHYNPPPYENPGYTVETPGHADSIPPSPYHAPPYYVQTPAMSERGGTPLSSAPSSPPHYGPGSGVPFIETRKKGSSRTNPMGKLNNGKFVPLNMLEEGDDEYPDEDRDRRRKQVRNIWICWIVLGIVVFLLGLGALITWLIFRPHAPRYTFQDLRIHSFYLQQDKPDGFGVSTDVVYANLSLLFTAKNTNKRYGMHFEKSFVSFGYSSIDNLAVGSVGSFKVGSGKAQNFTVWATAVKFPVYSAGHHLELDIASDYVPLTFETKFNSRVSIFWKIIKSSWLKKMDCVISIKATQPYRFLNTTCASI